MKTKFTPHNELKYILYYTALQPPYEEAQKPQKTINH